MKTTVPGRLKLTRMRSGNIRMVLLCFALLFQVLTFMRHEGVSYLGIPVGPDDSVESPLGPNGSVPTGRGVSLPDGTESLTSGASFSTGGTVLPQGSGTGSTTNPQLDASLAQGSPSAHPLAPSSGKSTGPLQAPQSATADPAPVAEESPESFPDSERDGSGNEGVAEPKGEAGGMPTGENTGRVEEEPGGTNGVGGEEGEWKEPGFEAGFAGSGEPADSGFAHPFGDQAG